MTETSFRAGEAEAGLRLDAALAARPECRSRAEAQRLIDGGRVAVDGEHRAKRHVLRPGELVTFRLDAEAGGQGEGDSPRFGVAYEDGHLLVVDKPAGLVVHPAAGVRGPTLAGALAGRAAGGDDPARAGIVHRLDRDTSGLMVVAKSEAAFAALRDMVAARQLDRRYLALVEGRPPSASGTVDAPLGRDRRRRSLRSTDSDRAKAAVTHFWVLESLPRTTLLGVHLDTGRTHQIRAHLSEIGHPVCGDSAYGGAASGSRLGLTRHFLHSNRLGFCHPLSGEDVVCESKPPTELRRALDAARREPVSGGPDGD
ncbi:MAG: RluA family pseudouridine synthase [Actinomycetota bacterium]|nr:RluA family pseudouridine synthase [Actinomycetota bacterium]